MKKLIGILLIILGIALSGYIALYLMFITGIMEIAKAIDMGSITVTLVAWNLIKIILALPVGKILFSIPVLSGSSLLAMD